jgi:hypothetical protein
MFLPPPPPPVSYPDLPYGVGQPDRRIPRPNHTWAGVYAAVGGVLVAGYFALASVAAVITLGGEPTADQRLESEGLWSAAALMALLTPLGAWLTHLVVRWADGREQSGTALLVVVVGWVVAFAAALQFVELLPSDDRAVGFGVMWAVGGMVVAPALAAVAAYAGSSRSRNRRASR